MKALLSSFSLQEDVKQVESFYGGTEMVPDVESFRRARKTPDVTSGIEPIRLTALLWTLKCWALKVS